MLIKKLIACCGLAAFTLFAVYACLVTPSYPDQVISGVASGYQGYFQPAVVTTIAASGATSAAIALKGYDLVGVYLPSVFTGTTLTFTACDTLAGTYVVVKSTTSGTTLSYTVGQGTYVAIDPKDLQGVNYLKLVSGSTEGSTRTLKLALKGL